MADFMSNYEPEALTHEVIGERQPLGPWISCRGLCEIPVGAQFERVVIPQHMGRQYLSASGVGDAGSHRVAYRERHPADDGETNILGAPIRIVRSIFGDDRVLEPGGF